MSASDWMELKHFLKCLAKRSDKLVKQVALLQAEVEYLKKLPKAEDYLTRGYVWMIVAAAYQVTGHTPAAITSSTRSAEMVKIRKAIIRIAIDKGRGVAEIGRALNRDHTTILHHLDEINRNCPKSVRKLVDDILDAMISTRDPRG